jgi:hypothetical protein
MPGKTARFDVYAGSPTTSRTVGWRKPGDTGDVVLDGQRHPTAPAWEITDAVVADSGPDALARALRFDEAFYRLTRK